MEHCALRRAVYELNSRLPFAGGSCALFHTKSLCSLVSSPPLNPCFSPVLGHPQLSGARAGRWLLLQDQYVPYVCHVPLCADWSMPVPTSMMLETAPEYSTVAGRPQKTCDVMCIPFYDLSCSSSPSPTCPDSNRRRWLHPHPCHPLPLVDDFHACRRRELRSHPRRWQDPHVRDQYECSIVHYHL